MLSRRCGRQYAHSAMSVGKRLSYVFSIHTPNLSHVRALAACAATALIGAAVAAPASLALSDAQRLAIERSPQIAAYDATIAATRDKALAERYAREAADAAAQKIATNVDIARETALAWLDCYYVERMVRIASDQLKS